jgi:hypothetical protein
MTQIFRYFLSFRKIFFLQKISFSFLFDDCLLAEKNWLFIWIVDEKLLLLRNLRWIRLILWLFGDRLRCLLTGRWFLTSRCCRRRICYCDHRANATLGRLNAEEWTDYMYSGLLVDWRCWRSCRVFRQFYYAAGHALQFAHILTALADYAANLKL